MLIVISFLYFFYRLNQSTFSSADIEVASEVDGEGEILREPVERVQVFLVSFESNYASAPTSWVVVCFGEVSGLDQVKLPAEVITGSEPIH